MLRMFMWSRFVLILIGFLLASCWKTSLTVNDSNSKKEITQDWLIKNNKALVFIWNVGEMQWKNITTNDDKDDIYSKPFGGGGYFFLISPGVYSLYYLEKSDRFCTYWIDKKATHKGKPAYYSFEVKAGEVLSVDSINFSGNHRDTFNPIKIKKDDHIVNKNYWKNWDLLPDGISPEEVKLAEVKEGINDPSFYHRGGFGRFCSDYKR